MSFANSPDVDQAAARPRKVTSKRGGSVDPDLPVASGPSGDHLTPDFPLPAGGPSGDSQSHTLPNEQVPPVVSGPSGPSRTMENPLK